MPKSNINVQLDLHTKITVDGKTKEGPAFSTLIEVQRHMVSGQQPRDLRTHLAMKLIAWINDLTREELGHDDVVSIADGPGDVTRRTAPLDMLVNALKTV